MVTITTPSGCKRPSDNQIMLRELVRFFLEVKVHEHAAYFVDSLWEHTDVLKVCGGEGGCEGVRR